ncbi:MAG: DUF4332 domain-containing protein [Alphaproteobacteria bacterium]|nr:DUF4332 domain-containing protein [Alphaproteobacteria bacterium]
MNLLFRIVYAAHASGTHHKLALDALRYLQSPDAERWQRLFLSHSEVYLEGSKAPDKEFKDFTNHVLHVGDNFWGGAPEKVESWYRMLVTALRNESWHEAAWAAGIMSHYYTDPIHPFHTAQSTAENNIHRAVEWSISKSYDALHARNCRKPLPEIGLGLDEAWLKDHVIAGAEYANTYYDTLIAHYNFTLGVVDPPEGLDEVCRNAIADLLAYAAVGHARLLDRAFAEADVTPPTVNLTAETFIAGLKIPVKWLTRKMSDAQERRQVEAIYDEFVDTGKVEDNLPDDDRQVRDLHRREVLEPREARRAATRSTRRSQSPLPQGQIPKLASALQPVRPAPEKTGLERQPVLAEPLPATALAPLPRLRDRLRDSDASETAHPAAAPATSVPLTMSKRPERAPRLYLTPSDDLEAAPSIGPKTAARFSAIGITTVAEFLDADPDESAAALDTRHIKAATIADWQHQAKLVCSLPGLRGGHAQLLVGAGLTSIDAIAAADPGEAMAAILRFAQTSEGQSVLRDGQPPDLEKIHAWVVGAQQVKAAAA